MHYVQDVVAIRFGTRTSRKAEKYHCFLNGVLQKLWSSSFRTLDRNSQYLVSGHFTPALIQNFKTAEQWAKERQMRKQGKLPAIDERQIEIPTD